MRMTRSTARSRTLITFRLKLHQGRRSPAGSRTQQWTLLCVLEWLQVSPSWNVHWGVTVGMVAQVQEAADLVGDRWQVGLAVQVLGPAGLVGDFKLVELLTSPRS